MSVEADRRRVRRAAVRVGVLVAVVSAAVVLGGIGVLVFVLFRAARPEHGESHGVRPDGDAVVVDLDRILPVVVILGLIGVVLLGLVGWLAARRAVRPLGEALATQRAFVSDASHELRTPLTALSSRIQLLQRRQAREEPTAELITELRRDVQVMDDVLTDMLLAAEGASSIDAVCDVARALARAVDTVAPLADDAGVTLRAGATVARAHIPEITLARLCVALLDNAVQHSPRGGEVDVTVDTDPQHVEIRVADRGPGIDPAHRERVFERFARSGEAGRRRGFGLGLALVREAATRYGGTVTIADTSPRGTVFALRLPSA